MAHSPLVPAPCAIVQKSQAEESAGVSRTSIALANQSCANLIQLKESLIADAARNSDSGREQIVEIVMRVAEVQKQIEKIKNPPVENGQLPEFTSADTRSMEKMKREGKTEQQIADLYETNQTKINRLLNNK